MRWYYQSLWYPLLMIAVQMLAPGLLQAARGAEQMTVQRQGSAQRWYLPELRAVQTRRVDKTPYFGAGCLNSAVQMAETYQSS